LWIAFLALAFAVPGCGGKSAVIEAPDDEAMKRLNWENAQPGAKYKTPDEAAEEYFLPDYYYKSASRKYESGDTKPKDNSTKEKDDWRKSNPPNYLKGMDRVAVSANAVSGPDNPLWLQTPVFQLLDKQLQKGVLPDFKIADPVDTSNVILGRNTWMLWCGGNEGFWDWLASDSLGFIDLLKLIDSRNRSGRFDKAGMINEPLMTQSGAPDPFGIWLDIPVDGETRKWRDDYLKKTFESIQAGQHESQRGLRDGQGAGYAADGKSGYGKSGYGKTEKPSGGYGGMERKANDYQNDPERGKEAQDYPPPEIYGLSSGVVGLRLFPNPNFDAEARKKWDSKKYYDDPNYYNDPGVVRPYRVGVACAFCHASFHPLFPPRDVTNPAWENISGNIGAQYLRIRATFGNLLTPDNFIYHILDSQPPGTIDTSLIASDNINNPNTMNSVFNLPQRALMSFRNPRESITAASKEQPSIWRHPETDPPTDGVDLIPPFYRKLFEGQGLAGEVAKSNQNPRDVARILLDGSDSIGAWGALARVYLNIGTYYEQWNRLHRPVIGFKEQGAFRIEDCDRHSLYWHATQQRVAALRDYFLTVSPPMPLVAAAVGEQAASRLNEARKSGTDEQKATATAAYTDIIKRRINPEKLARGRQVFARNCIVCHSSIQPESSAVTLYLKPDEKKERDEFNKRHQKLIDRRIASRADGGALGEFWEHDPVQWLRSEDYQKWAEEVIDNENFWRLNYLSTDYRVPITLVKTNSGRAMATNALDKNMWDDFTSESFQHLPSVGAIEYFDPYKGPNGGMSQYTPRHKVRNDKDRKKDDPQYIPEGGGGPGFYRVPTLVSIWSTAPLLHNNSLGKFTNDPSVNGRLEAFDDAIRKLLSPASRLESSSYNDATADRLKKDHGLIWRTTEESYLRISGRRVPELLGAEVAALMEFSEQYPWLKEIKPLWLPSGLLLLTSFLLLVLNSAKQRRLAGVVYLALAAAGALLGLFAKDWGCLSEINPWWLPVVLLFVAGLVFLAIDCIKTLRYLAYAGLILAVVGFVLYLLRGKSAWLASLHLVSLIQLSGLFGLILVLTERSKRTRSVVGYVLLSVAGLGLLANFLSANYGGFTSSESLGPLWIYSLFLIAAAIVVLTPDRRELTRYFGYSALVLSLTTGLLVNFFAGQLGDIIIGPIPKGTPVNLLTNVNPDANPKEVARALKITISALAEIKSKALKGDAAQTVLREKIAPALMSINKCPDFVMDKGHDFEWFKDMTEDDKECLIELLKTF
jgi:hypothetical protein